MGWHRSKVKKKTCGSKYYNLKMNKLKEIQAWYFQELGKEQSNNKVYRMKGMVRERINKRLKK